MEILKQKDEFYIGKNSYEADGRKVVQYCLVRKIPAIKTDRGLMREPLIPASDFTPEQWPKFCQLFSDYLLDYKKGGNK